MEYFIDSSPLEKQQQDCIIIGVYENEKLSSSASLLDSQTDGLVKKILTRGDIKGKTGETVLLNLSPDNNIERILVVGLGKSSTLTRKNYRKALNSAVKCLKDTSVKSASCCLAECAVENSDWQWKCRQIIEVFNDVCYQFTQLKSDNNSIIVLQTVQILVPEKNKKQAEDGLNQGTIIADAVSLAKELADLPGNICTPTYLAEKAVTLSENHQHLSVNVLEESDMEQLGMGALLSVTRGSRQPAKLIALEYQGKDKNTKPVVLVGKGLTFDAGGISLKPGAGMDEMKYDMCGGAAVLATLIAAARLELPLNIVGLIPASENLPDGDANKPGDIVTSMLGKTIEVLNTDAEGRLILCDTLTYAKKYNPEVIIDLATLTGACLVALGRVPSGLLGNDDELCNDLVAASESACDSLWRLPLWEEYQEQLKSNFADLANIGGRDAGTITAACFLSHFTEDYRWAHLDIAGTAWRTGNNKGATGRPVPLLMQYLINRAYA